MTMDRSKWEYKKLGDICKSINAGGTPSRGNSAYWNGDIPWVKIKDMNSKYVNSTEEFITDEGLNNSSAKLFEPDTILYSIFATIGAASILKIPATTNQAIAGIVLGDGCDRDFYYYYLTSLKTHFENISKGVAQNNINLSVLRNQKVVVPPIEDQQRIVAELDCLNEMIAVKQEQLKEFDKLAQSIFYDMFGDGLWEIRKIKDVATVKIGPFGSALHQSDYISGGTPLVNPVHMVNGTIIADNDFTVSGDKIVELLPYLLKTNDIVFGRRGDIGRCALVTENESGYLCGTGSMFVRFTININPVYALKTLSSEETRKYLLDNAKGATMLNINGGIVENIEIPLPPLSLQQQFADKISAIEAQKELVKQSIAETQTLLSYTMDKYFG